MENLLWAAQLGLYIGGFWFVWTRTNRHGQWWKQPLWAWKGGEAVRIAVALVVAAVRVVT